MNSYLAVTSLLLLTSTLFLLPLLPAFWELWRKSDALPLNVVQQHTGEIRYFADSFRAYLETLEPALQECNGSGRTASGVTPDGTDYLVLGSESDGLTLPASRLSHVLLASATDLTVSPESTFSKDIYSRGRFVGGANNSYRAILADREAYLGEGSSVIRWVHAVGELTVDSGCKLYGRVSSDCSIRLAPGCAFLRLNAPRIDLGQSRPDSAESSAVPPIPASITPQRSLHHGDLEIQPGQVVRGDLIVRGRLHLKSGAQVFGSIKSDKDVIIEPDVTVAGSIICARKLLIGSDCVIQGPVISEQQIAIETRTRCGRAHAPTTISAPRIAIASGVVVFGSVWAREHGEVLGSA